MASHVTAEVIETALTGLGLLNSLILNKVTAFSESARDTFSLHGLTRNSSATLLPPLENLPEVSMHVALAVGRQAASDGLAAVRGDDLVEALRSNVREPAYRPYKLRRS
jgi:malic enzyme